MRTFKTEGIVIKRRNVGEADRIITIFSKDHGKLQIKASGVRKITSRRSPHIELLNYVNLTLYTGKTYPILVEAQSKENFSTLKEDLHKVGLAYHICELIDGLCPEGQEHESVFELLKRTLVILSPDGYLGEGSPMYNDAGDSSSFDKLTTQNDLVFIIHEFEVELLALLGYWRGSQEVAKTLDTQHMIENILERKLKSRNIFAKLS